MSTRLPITWTADQQRRHIRQIMRVYALCWKANLCGLPERAACDLRMAKANREKSKGHFEDLTFEPLP